MCMYVRERESQIERESERVSKQIFGYDYKNQVLNINTNNRKSVNNINMELSMGR